MKNKNKNSLLVGSFVIILIVVTPYLLYLYQTIPEGIQKWDSFFGVINSGVYGEVQSIVYYFFAKFVPLLLLIIWFVTNKHWWVHAIIIPISVYLFQLISVINDSEEFIDEVEFIYTVPITVIIMVILYFVRSKMAIYIQAIDLKKEMDKNMKNPKKID
jgi:hypothetical protein